MRRRSVEIRVRNRHDIHIAIEKMPQSVDSFAHGTRLAPKLDHQGIGREQIKPVENQLGTVQPNQLGEGIVK